MGICFDLASEIIVNPKSGTEPRDRIGCEQGRDRHGVKFIVEEDKRVR